MISNSQGVSASSGDSMSAANGHAVDPCNVRDVLEPGLFRFLSPMQVR